MTPNTPTADDNSDDKTPNTDDTSQRLFECNHMVVVLDGNSQDDSEDLLHLLYTNGSPLAADEASKDSDNWDSLKSTITSQHPLLLKAISAILFESDPMCLNFYTNDDEYDPEAISIISELNGAKSVDDAADIVIEQFQHWFDCDLSPYKDNSKFIRMSRRIWVAWCEYRS